MVQFIRQRLLGTCISVEEDGAGPTLQASSGNLICRLGSGGKTMLSCHLDTPGDTRAVRHMLTGDRITSDGSTILGVDDRVGVAVLLCLLEEAAERPHAFNDFTVAFTICEESNMGGARFLALPTNLQQVYVFDSAYRPGHYIQGSTGAISWILDIARSGLPAAESLSPIKIAAQIIDELPEGLVDDATAFHISELASTQVGTTSPPSATLSGEIQGLTRAEIESQWDRLQQVVAQSCQALGGCFEFQWEWLFEPFLVSDQTQIVKHLKAQYDLLGIRAKGHIVAGGSDVNVFNMRGLPALNLGIGAQNPHRKDEFVLLEDLALDLELAKSIVLRT